MKKVLILVICLIWVQLSWAQAFRIGFNAGYGTYAMKSMKNFQQALVLSSHFEGLRQTQSFPGFINYGLLADIRFNNQFTFGIKADYLMTGGRNHVGDYSGEYYENLRLQAYGFGLVLGKELYDYGKLRFYASLKGTLLMSFFKFEQRINLYQSIDSHSQNDYLSLSLAVEPSAGIRYPLGKKGNLDFNLGYEKCTRSKLIPIPKIDGDLSPSLDLLEVDWTGLRVSLGLFLTLFDADAE